ncbi:Gamma-aminobutyric acid receptor subunit beta, partial [Armadillidium vulgare]
VFNIGQKSLVFEDESKVAAYPNTLEEYAVNNCELGKHNYSNYFNVTLEFSRRTDYILFTTYLPTWLLLSIGYGTLLLPVEAFPERGSMSLTTLLVLISLYAESSSALPKTTYLKSIDEWFVFCISYLWLVIAIHLATSHVSWDEMTRRANYANPLDTSITSATPRVNSPDSDDLLLVKLSKNVKEAWDIKSIKELKKMNKAQRKFRKGKDKLKEIISKVKYPSNKRILVCSRYLCFFILVGFVPIYFFMSRKIHLTVS